MRYLRPAFALTAFFFLATGLLFPLVVTVVSQAAFPRQADGSMLVRDGVLVGSALIGQRFEGDQWFHSRPSANDYDANSSGGTNLGPNNPRLLEGSDGFSGVQQLAEQFRSVNSVDDEVPLPADAVTRSASGLDPHISVANALLQAPRVARSRSLELLEVEALVHAYTEHPLPWESKAPRVNVLLLNSSLADVSK